MNKNQRIESLPLKQRLFLLLAFLIVGPLSGILLSFWIVGPIIVKLLKIPEMEGQSTWFTLMFVTPVCMILTTVLFTYLAYKKITIESREQDDREEFEQP